MKRKRKTPYVRPGMNEIKERGSGRGIIFLLLITIILLFAIIYLIKTGGMNRAKNNLEITKMIEEEKKLSEEKISSSEANEAKTSEKKLEQTSKDTKTENSVINEDEELENDEENKIYYNYLDTGENDFIYPSDTKIITNEELKQMDKKTVGFARNEIFARHGFAFEEGGYRRYFEGKNWYIRGKFSQNMLNNIEKQNINIILRFEQNKGWR